MHPLGEGLGQAVRERFGEDRRVVVVGRLELRDQHVDAVPRGDGERTDVVAQARLRGGDEVREREVRPALGLGHLLPHGVDRGQRTGGRIAVADGGTQDDVVVAAVAGQNPTTAFAWRSRSRTMRSRSARASRWRSRAAAPTVASFRIAG